jgi:hypothetical protein
MHELKGRSLLVTVSILTSLGFFLIGFDNGLMGGLGTHVLPRLAAITKRLIMTLVNGKAFNDTFGNPNATMVGLIVAIYEGTTAFPRPATPFPSNNAQLDVSLALSEPRYLGSSSVVARV